MSAEMRALGYARDSGGSGQERSVLQQREEITRYCAERGWQLVHLFADEARGGGSTAGREEFLELIEYAQPGTADAIVFWSSARVSRDVTDSQYYRALLRRRGYQLVSISDAVPDIGPWSALLETAKDVQDAERRKEISREARRGQLYVASLGFAPTGATPRCYTVQLVEYGQRRDGRPRLGRKWVPDPATWAAGRQAWEMRAAGYGLMTIARATGLYRNVSGMKGFFSNEIYRGTFVWHGERFENFCEPLATADEWAAVQARRRLDWTQRPSSPYVLTGMLFCGLCGARMHGRRLKSHHVDTAGQLRLYDSCYYLCRAKTERGGWRACASGHVDARQAERLVLETVLEAYGTPEGLARIQAAYEAAGAPRSEWQAETARLRAEIDDLDRRIARLLDDVEAGRGVSLRLSQREAERAAAVARLAELEARPPATLPTPAELTVTAQLLRQAWEQGDPQQVRAGLRALVDRVVMTPAGPHVVLRIRA